MSTAVRYTPQMQQELRSRFQLAERLVEFGWIPVVPEDLGEDFIINIYYEGRAFGVNFYVQLKSVTNLDERRKGNYLHYLFEVKDLLHWEQFKQPVVLIVWDVNLREGRWHLIGDAIKQLEQKHPSWRQQKRKTVQIPWQNNFLDDSLISLRHRIGEIFFPQIFKDKSFEFKGSISFPNTEEGQKELRAFEHAIKDGDPGSWEVQLEVPQELVPWLGGPKVENVKLFREPLSSGKRYSANIVAYDLTNHATSLNIELQVVKIGTESATLSNHHQDSFLHFLFTFVFVSDKLAFDAVTMVVNDHAEYLGQNSFESRDVLRFLNAIVNRGQIRIDLQTDSFIAKISNETKFPPSLRIESTTSIDKLCAIESKFLTPLKVPIKGFTKQERQKIDGLFAIIRHGKRILENQDVVVELAYQDFFKSFFKNSGEKNIRLKFEHSEFLYELLGKEFYLGEKVEFVIGKPIVPEGNVFATMKSGDTFSLKIQSSTVESIFPDLFLREAQRISQLLSSEFDINSLHLFGSLAWGETYTPETDIDLAVRGGKPEDLYKVVGYLESETSFPFDLIDLDEAPAALRERILREGELLYEREAVAVGG